MYVSTPLTKVEPAPPKVTVPEENALFCSTSPVNTVAAPLGTTRSARSLPVIVTIAFSPGAQLALSKAIVPVYAAPATVNETAEEATVEEATVRESPIVNVTVPDSRTCVAPQDQSSSSVT